MGVGGRLIINQPSIWGPNIPRVETPSTISAGCRRWYSMENHNFPQRFPKSCQKRNWRARNKQRRKKYRPSKSSAKSHRYEHLRSVWWISYRTFWIFFYSGKVCKLCKQPPRKNFTSSGHDWLVCLFWRADKGTLRVVRCPKMLINFVQKLFSHLERYF